MPSAPPLRQGAKGLSGHGSPHPADKGLMPTEKMDGILSRASESSISPQEPRKQVATTVGSAPHEFDQNRVTGKRQNSKPAGQEN